MPFRVSWFLFMLIITQFLLLGCEYRPKWEHFQEGIHLVLEVESVGNPTIDEENTTIIDYLLTERLRAFGIKRKIIKIQGERRIVVQLPKIKNPQRVIDVISKSAYLEFKLVDKSQSVDAALGGKIPAGDQALGASVRFRQGGDLTGGGRVERT